MRTIKLPLRRVHMQRNLRGYGLGGLFARIGSFLKPLLRTAVHAAKPIAKQTLKELGNQGLNVASSTLADVVAGNAPLKDAVKRNVKRGVKEAKSTVKQGAKRAFNATVDEIQEDIKRQRQTGSGRKKRAAKGNGRRLSKPRRGIFS